MNKSTLKYTISMVSKHKSKGINVWVVMCHFNGLLQFANCIQISNIKTMFECNLFVPCSLEVTNSSKSLLDTWYNYHGEVSIKKHGCFRCSCPLCSRAALDTWCSVYSNTNRTCPKLQIRLRIIIFRSSEAFIFWHQFCIHRTD
jgi:hypothetical protein